MDSSSLPAWATITYPLIFPVGDLTTLTFSEPNGEALEAIDELGIEEGKTPSVRQTMGLISALSGVPVETIRKFNQRDIKGAANALVPLVTGEPETSASP
ncbi:phage tail assembly protein [Rhizobium grahamii]|uniref:Phage tail assembly protein n=1 Tax=Rhizobium grahamii CCGE 502 TaxID=990285 RepID=S3HZJ7_9HYPH|nr:phage tail assembly protein [Rhizobium grahamii]EPE98441.1 hypothetical protein RGCCGE502_08440 [Rhizobium grahamii CCGE 502]